MHMLWVIIINWRQAQATINCVRSIEDSTPVIILDNGSGDDSVKILKSTLPNRQIFEMPANLGFTRAANLGMQYAFGYGAHGVLLLNNDTIVAPGSIERLSAALSDPCAGILSAKVYQFDHPTRFWSVGGIWTDRGVQSLGWGETDHGQYDQCNLDFVFGCAMLIPLRTFQRIGGFDERFFMYYEDVDLCLRARAAGLTVGLVPETRVSHIGSQSTASTPHVKLYLEGRSRQQFYRKHLSGAALRRFYLREYRYMLLLAFRHAMHGNLRNAIAYLRGCCDGLRIAGQ